MEPSLEEICSLVSGDKIKQRQDGLAKLQASFSSDSRVQLVDTKGWQLIFGALHQARGKELDAVTKKGLIDPTSASGPGAVALRRLAEVARTFRLLVQRSVKNLLSKTTREVLEYACSDLKYRGRLIEPVALDYLRSIEIILHWKPHLDHLIPDRSISLLTMAFNVVLEDPLKTQLEDSLETQVHEPSPGILESSEAEDEYTDASSSLSSKKRPRKVGSRFTQRPGVSSAVSADLSLKSVSPEKVAAAAVIRSILTSSGSPLICADYPFLPVTILNRFRRFLDMYPQKGTLHPDILDTLSKLLPHAALNKSVAVAQFARESWSALVTLWGNKDLKEHLVIIIRILIPFLTLEDDRFGPVSDCSASLIKLWGCLEKDAHITGKVEQLSLDSLRLQLLSDNETPGAFIGRTFRYGWMFDAKQALAWAVLELRADCMAKVNLCSLGHIFLSFCISLALYPVRVSTHHRSGRSQESKSRGACSRTSFGHLDGLRSPSSSLLPAVPAFSN
jgi:serine-protein kinase ATM